MAGVAAILGCEAAPDPPPRFSSADSAGIELVHSREPRWGTASAQERLFEFGETDGPDHLLFDGIRGVTRLEDGAIAVANQGSNSIRVLDPSGRLLREFGGSGDGPGEFTLLRGVMRCGSGVVTTFEYNWRQVLFDLEGRFLESRMISFPDDRFGVYTLACGRDGRMVGTGWGDAGTWDHPEGMYRSEGGLYVGETAAGPFEQIGTTAVDDRVRWSEGEGPHPFGRRTVVAVLADGFVLGTADEYSLVWHTPEGDTTRIARWNGADRPLTAPHVSAYLESRLAEAVEAEQPTIRREVGEYTMPDSLPAYSALEVSPDGVLWVREFSAEWWPSSRWSGFLPTGEWAWELLLEPGFEVTEFGADEVLGVATDELGIERVRGYRLELPRDVR